MRKNIGTADRVIRALLTATLLWLLVSHTISSSVAVFFGWALTAILAITVLDETCPIYLLLGISTRHKTNKS